MKEDSKNDSNDADSTSSSSKTSSDNQTSNFVDAQEKSDSKTSDSKNLSWYSKSDLLWVIWNYIEKNLKDDSEILVTIEYGENNDAEKIILKTQQKSSNNGHSVSDGYKSETSMVVADKKLDSTSTKKSNTTTSSKTSSNGLSQKDVRDAEELFSVLF